MSVSLVKGQKISLSKESKSLSTIKIGLGWDVNGGSGRGFDLDGHVYLLDKNRKLISEDHHISYANLRFGGDIIVHTGDNLTGEGDGEDEVIVAKLNRLPEEVNSLLVVVKIFQAKSRHQNFGMVRNAFVRVREQSNVLCEYNLTEAFSDETVVEIAEIYRHNGEWKLKAIGSGYVEESSFNATIQ